MTTRKALYIALLLVFGISTWLFSPIAAQQTGSIPEAVQRLDREMAEIKAQLETLRLSEGGIATRNRAMTISNEAGEEVVRISGGDNGGMSTLVRRLLLSVPLKWAVEVLDSTPPLTTV